MDVIAAACKMMVDLTGLHSLSGQTEDQHLREKKIFYSRPTETKDAGP